MATTTGRFAFVLPDYTDQGDILQENNNWSKAEANGLPNVVCTRLSRPASPYSGMVVYETDTGYTRIWDSLSSNWLALNTPRYTSATRPNGAFIGDTIVETDTGIKREWDGVRWKPLGRGTDLYVEGVADMVGIAGAQIDVTGMTLGAAFTGDGITPYELYLRVPNVIPIGTVADQDQLEVFVMESIDGGAYAEIAHVILTATGGLSGQFVNGDSLQRVITPSAGHTHAYKLQAKMTRGVETSWTIRGSATSPIILRLKEN